MRLILIFLLAFSLRSHGQEDKNRLGIQVGFNRMDFQVGLMYKYDHYALKPFASLEFGMNRTFFQHRIFPRVTFGGEYCLIKGKNLQVGPQLSYSYSFLKVNKISSHMNKYNELYGGLYLCAGGKLQFKMALLTGWQNERFYSTVTNKMSGANTLGFTMNLGLNYAF
ncbi:MAG: hypothetical protein RI922_1441 [Bacteroidota bacterium]